jgi:hypothetical protein
MVSKEERMKLLTINKKNNTFYNLDMIDPRQTYLYLLKKYNIDISMPIKSEDHLKISDEDEIINY